MVSQQVDAVEEVGNVSACRRARRQLKRARIAASVEPRETVNTHPAATQCRHVDALRDGPQHRQQPRYAHARWGARERGRQSQRGCGEHRSSTQGGAGRQHEATRQTRVAEAKSNQDKQPTVTTLKWRAGQGRHHHTHAAAEKAA
ncbi:hypothetical protein BU14_0022s0031 [Porphyra umbilicalis]|uniref:Uncharacterized protein n=1 Tax=Porphyra umbilicalis TaxID=2786 RepID=A0A1X6PKG3_PORUM|nr:hypothetical protein BU14_0022s0031 [Porphyra umbilicalis]|eukprot:OSX81310.1 hypothetical protein BU14_0022s0031 [Porphyra umbilicalis]